LQLNNYTKEFAYNWKLAMPVILGMLGHTFVGLLDNIMVGQLGTAELAAVSLGNSFVFVAMSIGIGFSTAITPLIAEADATKKIESARSSFKHGLFLCTVLGIVLAALVFAVKPILYEMGQPKEVVLLAIPYLELTAISLIPLTIFQAIKQFSDGMSMTKYPMYVTVLANLVNVALNYILIFGKFGFPELGIVGAAYGTLISRVIMVVYLLVLLRNNQVSSKIVKGIELFNLKLSMLKKIVSLGSLTAMQMFFEVAIFTSTIWLSGVLGKNPQAANQIALNLSSMTFMVAIGLGVTAMIRTGNQKGFQNFKELRRIAFSIFLLGFLFATFFAVVFLVFHKSLPMIYVDMQDEINYLDSIEVVKIAAQLLLIAAIFQISDSIQVVVLGALRGLQDVKIPTLLTFISYWIVGFPISYFLGKAKVLASFGIWLGLFSGLTTASILLFVRFNYLTKKLIREKLDLQQV